MMWPTRRLRHFVTLNPPVRELDMLPDGAEVAFLAMDSISDGGGYSVGELRAPATAGSYTRFANDDVVFAKVTPCFENGKRARMNNLPHGVGFGTTELTVLRSRSSADSGFLAYLVHEEGFRQGAIASMTGAGGLKRVSDRYVKDFTLPLPPIEEQRQIAAYLDRETGQIDELIAKQEQLLTILAERRQALISRMTTPPGDAKWSSGALKHYCSRITDGAHISPVTDDGVHPFVSTRDVQDGRIGVANALRTDESSYRYMVKTGCQPVSGDVLFSKDGTVGRTAVVDGETGPFVVASSLVILSPNVGRILPRYLDLVCRAESVQSQVRALVKGAGLPRLSVTNLMKIRLIVPPVELQLELIDHVARSEAMLADLATKATQMIALLRERRQALISAAVTGKIDVRSA